MSKIYLEEFLDQTARRGTWYGGGSASALACALAAALLEKLASRSETIRSLRAIRRRCARLVHQDAQAFARVIRAQARRDQWAAKHALKAAVEIPRDVYVASRQLAREAARIRNTLRPSYQVDLECALALAKASRDASRALILTNLTWLGDRAYSQRIHRVLSQRT